MIVPITFGCLSGILSGTMFALGFSWQYLQTQEHAPGLFTSILWIVPVIYGSLFSLFYALTASCAVALTLKLPLPTFFRIHTGHALTPVIICCVAYHLWQSPTPSYATMIEMGSFKHCCFLTAGFVTQATSWSNRRPTGELKTFPVST